MHKVIVCPAGFCKTFTAFLVLNDWLRDFFLCFDIYFTILGIPLHVMLRFSLKGPRALLLFAKDDSKRPDRAVIFTK